DLWTEEIEVFATFERRWPPGQRDETEELAITGLGRLPEVQRSLKDAEVEAVLGGAAREELPVGLVELRERLVHALGVVDHRRAGGRREHVLRHVQLGDVGVLLV